MENKNEFLGYFDGNANLSEILAAIESLPDTTKNFMADLFSNAPLSIFQAMRLEEYKKGEVFIRETAPADKVYFLIRGRVQAVENRVLGISYNFTHYNAFESFGTMEILLDYDAYRATLVADTDCQFLVLTREDYARWTETDSHALKLISKETCEYLLEEARKDRLLRFLSGKDSSTYPCENRTAARLRTWFLLLREYCESALTAIMHIHKQDRQLKEELSALIPLDPAALPAGWLKKVVRALVGAGFWQQTRSA